MAPRIHRLRMAQPARHVLRRVRQRSGDAAARADSFQRRSDGRVRTDDAGDTMACDASVLIHRLLSSSGVGRFGNARLGGNGAWRFERAVLVGRKLGQFPDEAYDRPDLLVVHAVLPGRHAGHLDAFLHHPEKLCRGPLARGIDEVRRRRGHAEGERLRRKTRRAMALHAVLTIQRQAALDLARLTELGHGNLGRALLDRAAHAGIEHPIGGRQVLVGRGDVVDTGMEDRRSSHGHDKSATAERSFIAACTGTRPCRARAPRLRRGRASRSADRRLRRADALRHAFGRIRQHAGEIDAPTYAIERRPHLALSVGHAGDVGDSAAAELSQEQADRSPDRRRAPAVGPGRTRQRRCEIGRISRMARSRAAKRLPKRPRWRRARQAPQQEIQSMNTQRAEASAWEGRLRRPSRSVAGRPTTQGIAARHPPRAGKPGEAVKSGEVHRPEGDRPGCEAHVRERGNRGPAPAQRSSGRRRSCQKSRT